MEKSWNQDRNKRDWFCLLKEVWWIKICTSLMVFKETNIFFFSVVLNFCKGKQIFVLPVFWWQAQKAVFAKPLSAKIIVVYSHGDDPRTIQHAHLSWFDFEVLKLWKSVEENKEFLMCRERQNQGNIISAPNYCWSWLHTRDVWISSQRAAKCMARWSH